RGKRGLWQPRIPARFAPRSRILLSQARSDLASQTGTIFQDRSDLAALLPDSVVPTVTRLAPLGLIPPLEQVHHQHFESVAQLAFVTPPHTLDLLCEVGVIESLPLALSEQRGLLLRPQVKILIVESLHWLHCCSPFVLPQRFSARLPAATWRWLSRVGTNPVKIIVRKRRLNNT